MACWKQKKFIFTSIVITNLIYKKEVKYLYLVNLHYCRSARRAAYSSINVKIAVMVFSTTWKSGVRLCKSLEFVFSVYLLYKVLIDHELTQSMSHKGMHIFIRGRVV